LGPHHPNSPAINLGYRNLVRKEKREKASTATPVDFGVNFWKVIDDFFVISFCCGTKSGSIFAISFPRFAVVFFALVAEKIPWERLKILGFAT